MSFLPTGRESPPSARARRSLARTEHERASATCHTPRVQVEALAWLRAAGSPAFEDMRNVMHMLGLRVSGVRRAVGEIGPALGEHVARDGEEDRQQATVAMEELAETVGEIEGGLELLRTTLKAIEELVVAPRRGARLHEMIGIADQLAQHHARPVGGVSWQPVPIDIAVALDRTLAISLLATAISLLGLGLAASKLAGPIVATYDHDPQRCGVWLTSSLTPDELERCASTLVRTMDGQVMITVRGSSLVVELPRTPAVPLVAEDA